MTSLLSLLFGILFPACQESHEVRGKAEHVLGLDRPLALRQRTGRLYPPGFAAEHLTEPKSSWQASASTGTHSSQ